MEVVAESNWRWMLFSTGDNYILSVLCGSVGLYTRDVELTTNELSEYATSGDKAIENLAVEISRNPSMFESRHIPSFATNEEARRAAKEWRESHGQRP